MREGCTEFLWLGINHRSNCGIFRGIITDDTTILNESQLHCNAKHRAVLGPVLKNRVLLQYIRPNPRRLNLSHLGIVISRVQLPRCFLKPGGRGGVVIELTVSCNLGTPRDMLFFRSFTQMRFLDWARDTGTASSAKTSMDVDSEAWRPIYMHVRPGG